MGSRRQRSKKRREEAAGDRSGKRQVCPDCGTKLPRSAKSCRNCGKILGEDADKPDSTKNIKQTLLYLGRDVGIAVLIVLIILGSIFAYTRVWPPMVVIESNSMQHSRSSTYIGVIDTGDLVLVQAAPERSDVTTWVEGRANGYTTYSNYGDVIIFRKAGAETPIIHRPIFWLEYDSLTNKYNIPDLEHLSLNVVWGGTYQNGTYVVRPYQLDYQIWIRGVGWDGGLNVTFNIGVDFISRNYGHSGYVTLGDNNKGVYDRTLTKQSDIIGKARGELPWFGLIKLTLFPGENDCCHGWGDSYVPTNSWNSLLISIILIILTPLLFDISSTFFGKRRGKLSESEYALADEKPVEEAESTSLAGEDEKSASKEDDTDKNDASIDAVETVKANGNG